MKPLFFDSYTATTSGISVMVSRVAGKFVVSVTSRNKKIEAVNAADENLARAVAWAIDSYAMNARGQK